MKEVSVEPRDEQLEKVEDFIEFLLRMDLDGIAEEERESLNYDINEVIVSLEGILHDYELAKYERDWAK